MKKLFLASLSCLLLVGCGGGDTTPKLGTKQLKAFDKSAPEVKQVWEKGLAADKANDFITANTVYTSLYQQNLTPEQTEAVQTALGAMTLRMNAAAANGDAAAKQAIDTLQANRRRPR